MRVSRLVRIAVAAAIMIAGVGLGAGTAGAEPVGDASPIVIQRDTGAVIQYTCTGEDDDLFTVAVSIDECYVKETLAGPPIAEASTTPLVVPGHVAITGDFTFTGLVAGDTFYLCVTVTSWYELKPRATTSRCDQHSI